MIRKLDKLWLRLLDRLNLWTLDWLAGHCRREQQRRLGRVLAWQRSELN